MKSNTLVHWFLNLLRNNLWIIGLAFIMYVVGTINALKFSDAAVSNAKNSLKLTFGSYIFLSEQLNSISDIPKSTEENVFLKESDDLKFQNQWEFSTMTTYLTAINNAELSVKAQPHSFNHTIKQTLFQEKHTDLLVSVYTYNLTVRHHNDMIKRFPYKFFTSYISIPVYPELTPPEILKGLPILVTQTSL